MYNLLLKLSTMRGYFKENKKTREERKLFKDKWQPYTGYFCRDVNNSARKFNCMYLFFLSKYVNHKRMHL